MKKLFAILLALAMVFAMSATALADGANTTVTLTIHGAAGHTYNIYQVFTGTVFTGDDGTPVLSDPEYGASCNRTGAVDPAILNSVLTATDLEVVLKTIAPNVMLENRAPNGSDDFIEISGLKPGYYMIEDVSTNLPIGDTISDIMVQLLENVDIYSKHAEITSEKKVDDKNDSKISENGKDWQDVADYDVNDYVPFHLSVNIPSTMANYDHGFHMTFHDTQSNGFDLPVVDENREDTLKVYIEKVIDGTVYTQEVPVAANNTAPGYTYAEGCSDPNCNCSFSVRVNDIEGLYTDPNFPYANTDKLVVEYVSQLTDRAVVGKNGNPNSMYVSHPNGKTQEDIVTVLTYALRIEKVDGADHTVSLDGAAFTLEKWIANEDGTDGTWETVKVMGSEVGRTTFEFSGLDGGQYRLTEDKAPDGYNTIAPIVFVINSNHATTWLGGNSALWNLVARDLDDTKNWFVDNDGTGEDGILEGNVENYRGSALPETGAQGTFMLITGGALLVLVAAVFMITRKKMSIYEG